MQETTNSRDTGKLELIACKTFEASNNLVPIIDFLNKSLKEKQIMFGVTRDSDTGQMTINIYEF